MTLPESESLLIEELLTEVVDTHNERSIQWDQSSYENHRALGYMFTALLERYYGIRLPHPIPSHIVCTMMAALKLVRISVNPEKRDSFVDAIAYTAIASVAVQKTREEFSEYVEDRKEEA